MKEVKTFTVTIWVGSKERDTGIIHTKDEVYTLCQNYCNKVGLCISVTPSKIIYTNGNEDGYAIGLINYPRFPSSKKKILNHALSLGKDLLKQNKQYKVSVVCNNKTYMIEKERI